MKKTIATTMTLIALAAAAFTSAPAMAEKNFVIDGSTTVGPIAKAFADYYKEKTGIGATISESGSGNGVSQCWTYIKYSMLPSGPLMGEKSRPAGVKWFAMA